MYSSRNQPKIDAPFVFTMIVVSWKPLQSARWMYTKFEHFLGGFLLDMRSQQETHVIAFFQLIRMSCRQCAKQQRPFSGLIYTPQASIEANGNIWRQILMCGPQRTTNKKTEKKTYLEDAPLYSLFHTKGKSGSHSFLEQTIQQISSVPSFIHLVLEMVILQRMERLQRQFR